ncbi:MAG: alkaline phosphatase family protein [Chitinophagales bacterium]
MRLFLFFLLSVFYFLLTAQEDKQKQKFVNHILWINIPDLSNEGLLDANCPNIKFTASKGLVNYQVINPENKDHYQAMLFSCNGENIMQALEKNNPDAKTAAFSSDKKLIKQLSGLDFVKKGSSDVEITELAYEYLRDERPNFLFINYSGVQNAFKKEGNVKSEAYQFAVEEVDVMLSGLFKGLIESRLYNSAAIVISSSSNISDNNNGLLLIQADGIIEAGTKLDVSISSERIMPTISELIGGIPEFNCSEKSLLQLLNKH